MNFKIKSIFIFLLIVGSLANCISQQNWFENNTKWVYDFATFGGGGLIVTECTNEDSLINNFSYKKITHIEYSINSSFSEIDTVNKEYLLLRQEGNKIYRYQNGERKIYDFDSEVGDTLYYMDFDDSYLPILEEISDTIIDNELLKYQDIRLVNLFNPSQEGIIRVIEKIGPINTFILTEYFTNSAPDFPYYYLKCYLDESISISSVNVFGLECDGLPMIVSNSDINFKELKVYPNPVKDILTIEVDNSHICEIKLLSNNGMKIRSINVKGGLNNKIDINDLQDGNYFLIGLDFNNKVKFSKKIIKNGGQH